MPAINVKANEDNIIHAESMMRVTSNDAFTSMAEDLLNADVSYWHLSAKTTVSSKFAGVSLSFHGMC